MNVVIPAFRILPREQGQVSKLFCFGLGYVATAFARTVADHWRIAGTRRTPGGSSTAWPSQDASDVVGWDAFTYDGGPLSADAMAALGNSTHLLFSIPPDERGDIALRSLAAASAQMQHLHCAVYLSTTGVYGNTEGAWVDETAPLQPTSGRGRNRVVAEQQVRDWAGQQEVPLFIFRLAGIYGPGRSALGQLKAGTARRIYKPGQVFSRIHVADIVQALSAAFDNPAKEGTYNLCDDAPAAAWEVIAHAARILEMPPPPVVPIHTAALSPMARSFYADCRRVRNDRLKRDLGVTLKYPTYKDGLAAIAADL